MRKGGSCLGCDSEEGCGVHGPEAPSGPTRFRKRPVVVTAEQFHPERHPWPAGVESHRASSTGYRIGTLEGGHDVTPGDWIITGVKGEKYPCKPDIFEMTYEPA